MPQVTSKHLQGITDLTLVAPIKQGFVDSLDTWTYKTRLRFVMQALNTSRAVTRERLRRTNNFNPSRCSRPRT